MKIKVGLVGISAAALIGIAIDEGGFFSSPYLDSAGVLTNGFGNTRNVIAGSKISVTKGLQDLKGNIAWVDACINSTMKGSELAQREIDAYGNLIFNIGCPAFRSGSIPKLVSEKNYTKACEKILEYDKITLNGKKVSCHDPANNCRGIIVRRTKAYETCMGI